LPCVARGRWLLDDHAFTDLGVGSPIVDGTNLFVAAQRYYRGA
jgi:hypothetical protein